MRMGIDARMFGLRVGGGGLGRYIAELVMHLQEVDKETEYVVFLKKENFHDFVIKQKNFSKRLVDIPYGSIKEQFNFPKEILLSKVQAMHYPHGNVPLWSRVPFVITLHDPSFFDDEAVGFSEQSSFTRGVAFAASRHIFEHAVYKSRHVISTSQETKRALLAHFRISPQKISIVYEGVQALTADARVKLEKLGILHPYVLSVGNAHPNKNQHILLEALRECEDIPSLQVVFSGAYDSYAQKLEHDAKKMGMGKRMRFIHAPTEGELYALVKGASLVAQPAHGGGFSALPLQAALLKTPVAVSDTPIFHEILGDGAQFIPPDDALAWAAVMRHAVEEPKAWNGLVTHSARHAKRYNWYDCAEATKEVYLRNAFPRM